VCRRRKAEESRKEEEINKTKTDEQKEIQKEEARRFAYRK
jgi:hypothetical protein